VAGFTLIELLIVIVMVAILAAIAIQYFFGYRASVYDARAMHDLGNAAVAQEAYYATSHVYVDFTAVGPAMLTVPGMVVSETVTLAGTASGEQFTVEATSSRGTGRTFIYDSITDTIRAN
jgi:type IV pilus assembly protein PilE